MRNGFTLIEMLIVIAIITILISVALPNAVAVRHQVNESNARQRVSTVARAEAALQICTASNNPCDQVQQLIPAPNSTITSPSYTYTMNGEGNHYTATPNDSAERVIHAEAENGWLLFCDTKVCD